MSFTQDDKDYLDLKFDPIKEDITELNTKFKSHDDETKKINDVQQQMIGSWNTVKYLVVPAAVGLVVSVLTWFITK